MLQLHASLGLIYSLEHNKIGGIGLIHVGFKDITLISDISAWMTACKPPSKNTF